ASHIGDELSSWDDGFTVASSHGCSLMQLSNSQ
ncbi:hypothetical protein NPIL_426971, partial [Nephila pilipes]